MSKKTKSLEVQNHKYCQETLMLKQSLELHFLEMGKRLMEIKEGQLYRPTWDTFEEYLMEMKWDKSRGYKIINIYKIFVLKYGIEPEKLAAAGGWSLLAEVLPVVSDKKSAVAWVKKATMHPQYELRDEIRDEKMRLQPTPSESVQEDDKKTKRYRVPVLISIAGDIFINSTSKAAARQEAEDICKISSIDELERSSKVLKQHDWLEPGDGKRSICAYLSGVEIIDKKS